MKTIRRILCPVDFTPVSEREVELAVTLATRFHATLILQHNLATDPDHETVWLHEPANLQDLKEIYARSVLAALVAGLPVLVRQRARAAITYGVLQERVSSLAAQTEAELIVVGTHGRSTMDHSSQTERLIGTAPCPVLTIRDDAPHRWLQHKPAMIATVVPIDFSEHSLAALLYALELRHILPIKITALYVPASEEFGAAWAEAKFSSFLPAGERAAFDLDLRTGKPVEEILDGQESLDARLVVMGAHVTGLIERLLFKTPSTSKEILHRSACPVWFVPATAKA